MDLLHNFLFTIHLFLFGGEKKNHMEWLPVSKSRSAIVEHFQCKDKPEENVAALKQASTVEALNNYAVCWCFEIEVLDLEVS